MLEGCRLGSRPLPVVRHASWWLTVRGRGGHNGEERQRGRPRLQWRLLTTLTSHRTDNGDHLGLSALLSSTSGWPTRHSVWSVKCPPPTEASEHPRTRDAVAPWMVRHSPQSKSQAVKPLI